LTTNSSPSAPKMLYPQKKIILKLFRNKKKTQKSHFNQMILNFLKKLVPENSEMFIKQLN